MTTPNDIIQSVQKMVDRPLFGDEGIRFGDNNAAITGITVCWMPDPQAIEFAANLGHNLIIHHEVLFFEPPAIPAYADIAHTYVSWPTNIQRRQLLEDHSLTACRIHGTMDEITTFEAFRNQLHLPEHFRQEPGNPFRKIYRIEPITYRELIANVKKAVGLTAIRHTIGDMNKTVRVVAIPWGGMALSWNTPYLAGLIKLGQIDVMIAGETDNYGFRFCKELDIEVIETSHEVSENPGIIDFVRLLRSEFPDLDVHYFENKITWTVS